MFYCFDCGIDTNKIHEYYMVNDDIWKKCIPKDKNDSFWWIMLCIGCLERRLGRILNINDFKNVILNDINCRMNKMSDRLKNRLTQL